MSSSANSALIPIFVSQVLPDWERFGLTRLAISAESLKQFKAQAMPETISTTIKRRIGKRTTRRGLRRFNAVRASWPEDDQAVFSYPALVYVIAGKADFHVTDYLVHCPQGHFFLFSDGVPRPSGARSHIEGDAFQRQCSVLWFFAPPGTNSVISYICQSEGDKHWCALDYHSVHRQEVLDSFRLFLQEIQEKTRDSEKIATLSFQTFLHLFLRELQEGHYHLAGASSAPDFHGSSISQIGLAQQYIRSHLNQPLTAALVASKVYMSRNNFMQRFAQETEQTFHEFVTRERMETAQALLRDGDWPIDVISNFIGLRPTQFRDQFRRHFGVAPSEFRRTVRRKGLSR